MNDIQKDVYERLYDNWIISNDKAEKFSLTMWINRCTSIDSKLDLLKNLKEIVNTDFINKTYKIDSELLDYLFTEHNYLDSLNYFKLEDNDVERLIALINTFIEYEELQNPPKTINTYSIEEFLTQGVSRFISEHSKELDNTPYNFESIVKHNIEDLVKYSSVNQTNYIDCLRKIQENLKVVQFSKELKSFLKQLIEVKINELLIRQSSIESIETKTNKQSSKQLIKNIDYKIERNRYKKKYRRLKCKLNMIKSILLNSLHYNESSAEILKVLEG